jgi:hypothetical protein
MALAINEPLKALQKARAQLILIDGTTDEWNFDVAVHEEQTRAYVLEQIDPQKCPWVFAALDTFNLDATPSACTEGEGSYLVYGVMKPDGERFGDEKIEILTLLLMGDVIKTLTASPGFEGGFLRRIQLEAFDLDPENEAWGFFMLRCLWTTNGMLGQ